MNLQYYKQNVSIIQLVETLGYTYNRNKGRHPRQYEHPNGDKVIIYDKAKSIGESYFTRNNYDDKGSVIDFVKNRLPMFNVHYNSEWEGVMKVLSEFVDQTYLPNRNALQPVKLKNELQRPFKSDDFIIKSASLKDLNYLQYDRNLNKETLNTFLPYIQIVQEKGRRYQNIGFPYVILVSGGQHGMEVVGFELANHSFKGHAKGSKRRHAVWIADLSNAPQLTNNLYAAESAIDAMSFYELYQGKYNFNNSVFISTGGNVLGYQVINVLNAFPNAKINTLFDNDFSGKLYDIFLAGIKTKRELKITRESDTVVFQLEKGKFKIPIEQLSLSRFEKVTGIRSGIRPFKSEGKDFNEMLQKRSETLEKLKTTNGPRR